MDTNETSRIQNTGDRKQDRGLRFFPVFFFALSFVANIKTYSPKYNLSKSNCSCSYMRFIIPIISLW